MHKARAMLDALMGPGRDVVEKDTKVNKKEKFKDRTVCKGFLIGFCPLDSTVLGGKRKFGVCEKIHSELMRDQLKGHEECAKLTRDYEALSLQDLEYCVRECEAHIVNEKQRIREDVRRKKPPLPPAVNDRLAAMKRESSAMIQKAEELDDDNMREKEALTNKANEMLKDREEMLEDETKKAIEAQTPEEVCDICGTAYTGKDGDAQHLKFRIHDAYVKIRERIAELKPRIDELQAERQKKKEEEAKKKRKEEWDKAQEKEAKKKRKRGSDEEGGDEKGGDEKGDDEKGDGEKGDDDKGDDKKGDDKKGRSRGKDDDDEKEKKSSRDKDRRGSRDRKDRSRSRGRRDRDRSRSRKRKDRSRSRRGGGRDRSRGKRRGRSRS